MDKLASLQKENEELSQAIKDLRELREYDAKSITRLNFELTTQRAQLDFANSELELARSRLQAVREAVA